MREVGIEPTKALSHRILSPARLTAPEPPLNLIMKRSFVLFKKIANITKEK